MRRLPAVLAAALCAAFTAGPRAAAATHLRSRTRMHSESHSDHPQVGGEPSNSPDIEIEDATRSDELFSEDHQSFGDQESEESPSADMHGKNAFSGRVQQLALHVAKLAALQEGDSDGGSDGAEAIDVPPPDLELLRAIDSLLSDPTDPLGLREALRKNAEEAGLAAEDVDALSSTLDTETIFPELASGPGEGFVREWLRVGAHERSRSLDSFGGSSPSERDGLSAHSSVLDCFCGAPAALDPIILRGCQHAMCRACHLGTWRDTETPNSVPAEADATTGDTSGACRWVWEYDGNMHGPAFPSDGSESRFHPIPRESPRDLRQIAGTGTGTDQDEDRREFYRGGRWGFGTPASGAEVIPHMPLCALCRHDYPKTEWRVCGECLEDDKGKLRAHRSGPGGPGGFGRGIGPFGPKFAAGRHASSRIDFTPAPRKAPIDDLAFLARGTDVGDANDDGASDDTLQSQSPGGSGSTGDSATVPLKQLLLAALKDQKSRVHFLRYLHHRLTPRIDELGRAVATLAKAVLRPDMDPEKTRQYSDEPHPYVVTDDDTVTYVPDERNDHQHPERTHRLTEMQYLDAVTYPIKQALARAIFRNVLTHTFRTTLCLWFAYAVMVLSVREDVWGFGKLHPDYDVEPLHTHPDDARPGCGLAEPQPYDPSDREWRRVDPVTGLQPGDELVNWMDRSVLDPTYGRVMRAVGALAPDSTLQLPRISTWFNREVAYSFATWAVFIQDVENRTWELENGGCRNELRAMWREGLLKTEDLDVILHASAESAHMWDHDQSKDRPQSRMCRHVYREYQRARAEGEARTKSGSLLTVQKTGSGQEAGNGQAQEGGVDRCAAADAPAPSPRRSIGNRSTTMMKTATKSWPPFADSARWSRFFEALVATEFDKSPPRRTTNLVSLRQQIALYAIDGAERAWQIVINEPIIHLIYPGRGLFSLSAWKKVLLTNNVQWNAHVGVALATNAAFGVVPRTFYDILLPYMCSWYPSGWFEWAPEHPGRFTRDLLLPFVDPGNANDVGADIWDEEVWGMSGPRMSALFAHWRDADMRQLPLNAISNFATRVQLWNGDTGVLHSKPSREMNSPIRKQLRRIRSGLKHGHLPSFYNDAYEGAATGHRSPGSMPWGLPLLNQGQSSRPGLLAAQTTQRQTPVVDLSNPEYPVLADPTLAYPSVSARRADATARILQHFRAWGFSRALGCFRWSTVLWGFLLVPFTYLFTLLWWWLRRNWTNLSGKFADTSPAHPRSLRTRVLRVGELLAGVPLTAATEEAMSADPESNHRPPSCSWWPPQETARLREFLTNPEGPADFAAYERRFQRNALRKAVRAKQAAKTPEQRSARLAGEMKRGHDEQIHFVTARGQYKQAQAMRQCAAWLSTLSVGDSGGEGWRPEPELLDEHTVTVQRGFRHVPFAEAVADLHEFPPSEIANEDLVRMFSTTEIRDKPSWSVPGPGGTTAAANLVNCALALLDARAEHAPDAQARYYTAYAARDLREQRRLHGGHIADLAYFEGAAFVPTRGELAVAAGKLKQELVVVRRRLADLEAGSETTASSVSEVGDNCAGVADAAARQELEVLDTNLELRLRLVDDILRKGCVFVGETHSVCTREANFQRGIMGNILQGHQFFQGADGNEAYEAIKRFDPRRWKAWEALVRADETKLDLGTRRMLEFVDRLGTSWYDHDDHTRNLDRARMVLAMMITEAADAESLAAGREIPGYSVKVAARLPRDQCTWDKARLREICDELPRLITAVLQGARTLASSPSDTAVFQQNRDAARDWLALARAAWDSLASLQESDGTASREAMQGSLLALTLALYGMNLDRAVDAMETPPPAQGS